MRTEEPSYQDDEEHRGVELQNLNLDYSSWSSIHRLNEMIHQGFRICQSLIFFMMGYCRFSNPISRTTTATMRAKLAP